MGSLTWFRLPLIVQCFLFFIPVNIYVVGDWLAAGVQWIFLRYQQSYLGNSLIFFTRDLNYIEEGLFKGRSAVAAEAGVAATVFMVLAVILLLIAYQKESGAGVKFAAIASMGGGCLYLVSDIIQYGVFFHGPAGFVIPVGVPIILICGRGMYRLKFPDADMEGVVESEIAKENERQ